MTIKEELEAIKDASADGRLYPREVVDWARDNAASVLHSQFTWDDVKAADEFRLEEARRLIRVYVVTEAGEPRLISLRCDWNRGGGYREIDEIAKSRDLSEMMLREALSDLRRVRERYKRVKQLTDIWASIDAAQEKHQPETLPQPEGLRA